VRSQLLAFAQHKFASNVVEKCLQFGGKASRLAMMETLLAGEGGSGSTLMALIRDQYANYVIQKVIDLADAPHLARVLFLLGDQLPAVKRGAYGKHIVAKLERATGRKLGDTRSDRDARDGDTRNASAASAAAAGGAGYRQGGGQQGANAVHSGSGGEWAGSY
jgi:pumilio RNA-binding family